MDRIVQMILDFLLQLLTLMVQFFIAALNLVLQFAQNIIAAVR